MTATAPKITPTQRRILAVLADGEAHSFAELIDALGDVDDRSRVYENDSVYRRLKVEVSRLRKHLREKNQDVLCVRRSWREGKGMAYRQVRLLRPRPRVT